MPTGELKCNYLILKNIFQGWPIGERAFVHNLDTFRQIVSKSKFMNWIFHVPGKWEVDRNEGDNYLKSNKNIINSSLQREKNICP